MKVIPEILGLYNKDESNYLRSCYTNEDSCNSYIHNIVNNYDLHLLNTLPKRLYDYKVIKVFPDDPYDDFNSNMKEKIFLKNKINNLNDLTEEREDDLIEKYNLRLRFRDLELEKIETSINLEKNKEHFYEILEYKIKRIIQYGRSTFYCPEIQLISKKSEKRR